MTTLIREVDANFEKSKKKFLDQITKASGITCADASVLRDSYRRIVSFQAWRSELLTGLMSADAIAFFLEAQNDFVSSHVLARFGLHRPALKSLRSAIENVYCSLYYADHPVELQKWLESRHRIDRTELEKYLRSHPAVYPLSKTKVDGIDELSAQYKKLNLAVHASTDSMRMTANLRDITVSSDDLSSLRKWASTERHVTRAANMLLLSFYHTYLQGNSHTNLRKIVGLSLTVKQKDLVKKHLAVSLPR